MRVSHVGTREAYPHALSFSLSHTLIDLATFLLDAGADVNTRDCDGHTPLMLACGYVDMCMHVHSVGMARLLLLRGADVHARNRLGWTVLHKVHHTLTCHVSYTHALLVLLTPVLTYTHPTPTQALAEEPDMPLALLLVLEWGSKVCIAWHTVISRS